MDYWTNYVRKIHSCGFGKPKQLAGKPEIISGGTREQMKDDHWIIEKALDGKLFWLTMVEKYRGQAPIYTWKPAQEKDFPVAFRTREAAEEIARRCRGRIRKMEARSTTGEIERRLKIHHSAIKNRAERLGITGIRIGQATWYTEEEITKIAEG